VDLGSVLGAGVDRHVVVQFERPIDASAKARLEASGVALQRYLGSNAHFVKLTSGPGAIQAASETGMVAAYEIELDWKLHPMVARGELPDYAVAKVAGLTLLDPDEEIDTAALYVIFHPDVDLDNEGALAITRHDAVIYSYMWSINAVVVWVPLANVLELAAEDVVQWVEPPLPPLDVVNDSNRAITQVDVVNAPPYNLDGTGVNVLVYDGGYARQSHVDFGGRLTVRDSSGMSNHSTHVAGTIGGDGTASGGTYAGMAPGVVIQSYGFQAPMVPGFLYTDPGDLEADYDEAINTYGAEISNNSIGSNVAPNGFPCEWEGDYGATAQLIDAIVGGSLGAPMRIVWANGNERGPGTCGTTYHTTAPPACAKNHITVGALNSNNDSMTSFSSWGPTDDGRIKPDVAGPGCQSNGDMAVTSCSSSSDTAYTTMCGTSMSSPTVTGICALILQDWKAQFPADPLPRNSTLKVLLAHNAVDLGNTGPDYGYGYGSVRTQDTIDFMRRGGDPYMGSFLEESIAQGEDKLYLISLSTPTPFLKATIAWDDPPGAVNTIPELVNDLDIVAIAPDSTVHYPWTLDPSNPGDPAVRTQADHVNNIEQVVVDAPALGTWTIKVSGYAVPTGPQIFSLATTPDFSTATSAGVIALDADAYACSDTATITVRDIDLNTDPGTAETTTVAIYSDTEPAGENVLLTETGPDTSVFAGTISLSVTDAPGVLWVSHADTVSATYEDADDGTGNPATVTDTATVDCQGPVISNVQVSNIGLYSATITFDTDEPTTGRVRCGETCGGPYPIVEEDLNLDTSHAVVLSDLSHGTTYRFEVDAFDVAGNSTTDDNGGACYSFDTKGYIHWFPLDSDPGWPTEGQWEFGVPLGLGGQYGNPDPTSGYTGPNVYGYNLSGDYANNIPTYYLTTAALDCSGYTNIHLVFWRWLGVEQPLYDHASINVSNDGFTWDPVWSNSIQVTDGAWTFLEYDISLTADDQPTVYIRWGMGPTDSSWQFCGWNIDDIGLTGDAIYDLDISPTGDFLPSGPEGGPFTPSSRTYTLTNTGTTALDWSASATEPWLDVTPAGGMLNGGGSTMVQVALNANANGLAPGTHTDTVTFTDTTSGTDQTRGVSLEVRPVDSFTWDAVPSPRWLNSPFWVTITALDSQGATVTAFDGTVDLSAFKAGGPSASTIVITEIDRSAPDFIEIQNVSGQAVDTSGWVVAVSDDYSNINLVNSVLWSLPSSMAADEVLYRTDDSGDNYWGSNLFWNNSDPGWAMIVDDAGNLVDFLAWGWSAANIAGMNPTVNGFPISIGSEWSGDGIADGPESETMQREGNEDHDDATDFPWVSPKSKGLQNAGLTVPFVGAGVPVAITPIVSGSFVDGVWTGTISVLEQGTDVWLRAEDGSGHSGDSNMFDVEPVPPPVVVNVTSTHANGAFTVGEIIDVDVEFSQNVTVTGTPSLDLNTGRTVDYTGGTGADTLTFTYTVGPGEMSGDLDYIGSNVLHLNGGAIRDAATNTVDADLQLPMPGAAGSLGANKNIEIDTLAPSVTVGSTSPSPTNAAPIPFDVDFDESVSDFVQGDVQVTNGAIAVFSGSGMNYDVTVTPSGDGAVTVTVNAGVAHDTAGNPNQGPASHSVTYDSTEPTVTVGSTSASPTNAAPIPFDIDFDESVGDFVQGDVQVTNGSIAGFSGSGMNYDATVTPAGDGDVTVTVNAGVAHDAAGNPNQGPASHAVTYDGTEPTVTVSSTESSPTNADPIPFDVDFDESVSDFVQGDVQVTNGSIAGFSGSGMNYDVTVTPAGDGDVTVTISAGAAHDAAGNPNQGPASHAVTYDGTEPTVAVSSTETSPTNTDPIPFDVDFDESVSDFVQGDVQVTNGSIAGFSGSGMNYDVTVTPTGDGDVTVTISAGVAHDAAGNPNQGPASHAVTYDGTAPTVAVSSTETSPTNTDPIPFDVDFNESVSDFVQGDVQVTNGSIAVFSGSGMNYDVTVTPTGDGDVTVTVAAGVAHDAAGNPNQGPASHAVTYDGTAPTVAVSSTEMSPTNTDPIPFDIDFNESVSDFVEADVQVTNGSIAGFSGSGMNYDVTVTPSGDGDVTVTVDVGVAHDAAGNPNQGPASHAVTYDGTAPTVTVSSTATSPTNTAPIPFDVDFNESVSDFVEADVQVTNGSISGFSGSGMNYDVTVTPAGDGDVTVTISAGVAHDAAGNPNQGPASHAVTYDGSEPTVTVSSTATSPTNTAPIPFDVDFNESVSDFVEADVQVTNGSISGFSGSGMNYDVTVTPAADGDVTVTVAAGCAHDAAGNPNTGPASHGLVYDGTPPDAAIALDGPSPTEADAVSFSVDFTEGVAGTFDAADVTVTGSLAGLAGAFVSGTDPDYTVAVTISDPEADGTVGIAVGTAVTDAAGNPFAGGASPLYHIHNWHGFSAQPQGGDRYAGDGHTFAVAVDHGASIPTYQWKWDDGAKAVHDVGVNSDTFPIPNVSTADRGDYWCEVTYDGLTYLSDAATLAVEEHLAIVQQPEGADTYVDESHTFSVATTGGYLPLSYLWKQDGLEVSTDSTYTINPLAVEHSGGYTVEVADANSDVCVSDPAILSVSSGAPAAGAAALAALLCAFVAGGLAALRRRP